MEKVNKNNYEAYLVDYFEDNLSLEDRNQVDLFLNAHPKIRQEVSEWVDDPASFSDYGYNYNCLNGNEKYSDGNENYSDGNEKYSDGNEKFKNHGNESHPITNWRKFSYAIAACISLFLIGGGVIYLVDLNSGHTPSQTVTYNKIVEIADSAYNLGQHDLGLALMDKKDDLGLAPMSKTSDLGLAPMDKTSDWGQAQIDEKEKKNYQEVDFVDSTIELVNPKVELISPKVELSHSNIQLKVNDTINFELIDPSFEVLKSLFDWTAPQQLEEVAESGENNNNEKKPFLAYIRKNTQKIVLKINRNYYQKKAKVENSIFNLNRLLATNSSQE